MQLYFLIISHFEMMLFHWDTARCHGRDNTVIILSAAANICNSQFKMGDVDAADNFVSNSRTGTGASWREEHDKRILNRLLLATTHIRDCIHNTLLDTVNWRTVSFWCRWHSFGLTLECICDSILSAASDGEY